MHASVPGASFASKRVRREVKNIVDAVLYLESASFVTGEVLHVSGGQSLGLT
jgi:hypothetical protein